MVDVVLHTAGTRDHDNPAVEAKRHPVSDTLVRIECDTPLIAGRIGKSMCPVENEDFVEHARAARRVSRNEHHRARARKLSVAEPSVEGQRESKNPFRCSMIRVFQAVSVVSGWQKPISREMSGRLRLPNVPSRLPSTDEAAAISAGPASAGWPSVAQRTPRTMPELTSSERDELTRLEAAFATFAEYSLTMEREAERQRCGSSAATLRAERDRQRRAGWACGPSQTRPPEPSCCWGAWWRSRARSTR